MPISSIVCFLFLLVHAPTVVAFRSSYPASAALCSLELPRTRSTRVVLAQLPVPTLHDSSFETISAAVSPESRSMRDAYNKVSRTFTGPDACLQAGIAGLGIREPSHVYKNLAFPELLEHEKQNKEGVVVHADYGDTFCVDTGKFTGRSPKDKFVVKYPGSEVDRNIDWNSINQPVAPEVFDELYEKAVKHFNTRETAYVFDGYCGASQKSQKKIRFVTEMAWQQHFCTNMFIRPEESSEIDDFEPDFTIINCCSQVDEDWERHGLHSDTAVVFNIEKKVAVIFGTSYGGEMKKGIFSLMNYWLPLKGQLTMHCSANTGKEGDSALFFGLSGTGKTTLSTDPNRFLVGDDEHGWDEDGIFNLEGGCYAKTINLREEAETDIYRAIRTDALLENIGLVEKEDGKLVPDFFDSSKTENGRVSYPIFHIPNYVRLFIACNCNEDFLRFENAYT